MEAEAGAHRPSELLATSHRAAGQAGIRARCGAGWPHGQQREAHEVLSRAPDAQALPRGARHNIDSVMDSRRERLASAREVMLHRIRSRRRSCYTINLILSVIFPELQGSAPSPWAPNPTRGRRAKLHTVENNQRGGGIPSPCLSGAPEGIAPVPPPNSRGGNPPTKEADRNDRKGHINGHCRSGEG